MATTPLTVTTTPGRIPGSEIIGRPYLSWSMSEDGIICPARGCGHFLPWLSSKADLLRSEDPSDPTKALALLEHEHEMLHYEQLGWPCWYEGCETPATLLAYSKVARKSAICCPDHNPTKRKFAEFAPAG